MKTEKEYLKSLQAFENELRMSEKNQELTVAEQAMEATIFKTILNVGAGNTTTTQGKEEVINAVHQFLDAMKQQGLVILNKAFD